VGLPSDLVDEAIAWCLAGRPEEACGLLVGDAPAAEGGVASRFLPMRNAARSPYRYLMDPDEVLTVLDALDDRGETVWGIVHSHVDSPAEPSATDIRLASFPGSLYLICSLARADPQLRAWRIDDGRVTEVPLHPVSRRGRRDERPAIPR
jgi:proteasome lid subunit RPN8/RPN11